MVRPSIWVRMTGSSPSLRSMPLEQRAGGPPGCRRGSTGCCAYLVRAFSARSWTCGDSPARRVTSSLGVGGRVEQLDRRSARSSCSSCDEAAGVAGQHRRGCGPARPCSPGSTWSSRPAVPTTIVAIVGTIMMRPSLVQIGRSRSRPDRPAETRHDAVRRAWRLLTSPPPVGPGAVTAPHTDRRWAPEFHRDGAHSGREAAGPLVRDDSITARGK